MCHIISLILISQTFKLVNILNRWHTTKKRRKSIINTKFKTMDPLGSRNREIKRISTQGILSRLGMFYCLNSVII